MRGRGRNLLAPAPVDCRGGPHHDGLGHEAPGQREDETEDQPSAFEVETMLFLLRTRSSSMATGVGERHSHPVPTRFWSFVGGGGGVAGLGNDVSILTPTDLDACQFFRQLQGLRRCFL